MIMAKLKEATREQHEGTEQSVSIMDQMFSIDNYKTLLSKFYRFYSSMETELVKLDLKKYGYEFADRLKTSKLETDLKNLGIWDEAKMLPAFQKTPKVDSPEKAFGCLYVLEGATLGGQIIKRHLKEHLDLTSDNGGSFFNGYGEKTGEMWKEFIQITTDFANSANDDETIIQTAKETFDSINECFREEISLGKTAN